MLSAATLNFLSPQPDVNDQQIDDLVGYAATNRPDAWEAIKLMHSEGQDNMIASYLLHLQDPKLSALGLMLPSVWKRYENYMQLSQKRQAEADMQPEAMQQQMSMQEMIIRVSPWMHAQSTDVCITTICRAIDATAKAGMVRCKQDWAGVVRLIRDEGGWLSGLTNKMFTTMVADHCHIDKSLKPTEPSLKVLSFGSTRFPAWKVGSYDPAQHKSLVQMAGHFLQHIDQQVQQALSLEQNHPLA